jgi:hypothetical protein
MKKSLALAFETQRHTKSKKKMAEGGSIKEESRPMPDDKHEDSKMVDRNEGRKEIKDSNFTTRSSKMPLSAPKMTESSVIKAKLIKDMRDEDIKMMADGGDVEKRKKSMTETFGDQSGQKAPDEKAMDWIKSKFAHGGEAEMEEEQY